MATSTAQADPQNAYVQRSKHCAPMTASISTLAQTDKSVKMRTFVTSDVEYKNESNEDGIQPLSLAGKQIETSVRGRASFYEQAVAAMGEELCLGLDFFWSALSSCRSLRFALWSFCISMSHEPE